MDHDSRFKKLFEKVGNTKFMAEFWIKRFCTEMQHQKKKTRIFIWFINISRCGREDLIFTIYFLVVVFDMTLIIDVHCVIENCHSTSTKKKKEHTVSWEIQKSWITKKGHKSLAESRKALNFFISFNQWHFHKNNCNWKWTRDCVKNTLS